MNTRLLITFVSAIFIALSLGIAFMYFFGDVISYYLGPMDKGIGFYAMGGGTTVALAFMLAIDITLCVIYFRRTLEKRNRFGKSYRTEPSKD